MSAPAALLLAAAVLVALVQPVVFLGIAAGMWAAASLAHRATVRQTGVGMVKGGARRIRTGRL